MSKFIVETYREIAEFFGVEEGTIKTEWTPAGMPGERPRGKRKGRYDLAEIVQWYRATFKGVLGFLPNKTKEDIQRELRDVLVAEGGDWLSEHFDMSFLYRHDCNEVAAGHPVVQSLEAACTASGHEPEVAAMPASCDAWFYTNLIDRCTRREPSCRWPRRTPLIPR